MSMSVDILIKGLAIGYTKEDITTVTFICDQSHPVNFSYSSGGTPSEVSFPVRAIGKDRSIEFSDTNTGPHLQGTGFASIFNMAERYAHGPYLLIENRIGEKGIVSVQLPQATIHGIMALGTPRYYIQDASFVGAPA